MIKPLLRTIPTMSGNVKIACTLLDYNKISKDTFETNIRGAYLFPLSSQLFQKSVKVSLLNSSYEYDLKRFYSAYSDTFYSPCFEYDKTDIKMLDRSSVVYTRNTDFEYGVKRISYVKSGCQFACFAPIYIDNVDDIPSYYMINVEIQSSKQTVTKHIRVNLGINGKSDSNYIYKYLSKYLSNIDDNVIYMDNTDKSLTYYGIDVVNGGFTKSTDATVKNLFNIHMPIQMFDRTISIGFERNNVVIRQVLPLSFYFNVQDILTDVELAKFKFASFKFSGAYYDKNGKELKWYDFDWDYTKYTNDILLMNPINGIVQETSGYTDNIMGVGFPALYDKYLTNYQLSNKLTTTFSKWKLKYSTDEWPYITNMSWAFSNNQDSTYKYREFPVTFTNQAGYAIIDDRNKYNLIFPLGEDIKNYNKINPRSSKKYEAIMNNYCLNWFELFFDRNNIGLPIEELIKQNKDDLYWSDVNNGYTYYKGVLYNFNLIYDKVSNFIDENKINKFAFIVYPNTMNIINDSNKDSVKFSSLSILPKELNNTEKILNNCLFNREILDIEETSNDEYIPLFKTNNVKREDNLLFNEIFDVISQDKIDESFEDEPIFINSNDINIDIYKNNTLIKPEEYPGLYKLSNLKNIKPINDETYFGAHFINALITIFNTVEIAKDKYETIEQIEVVSDNVLFRRNTEKEDELKYVYDNDNLRKIAKRIFYSDSKGRIAFDLISDFYHKKNGDTHTSTILRNDKYANLFVNGKFPEQNDNNGSNFFSMYSYFSRGPIDNNGEIISENKVSAIHRNPKIFDSKPEFLLLALAEVLSEAIKQYQRDETFGEFLPFIFNDFGYEFWELLPIFRGKLFTSNDGKLLSSLQDAIKTYANPNNSQYDHLVKDIYINYNKYHSFNPEKLIYKSGERVIVNEILYQDLLNDTYEHTLYYKSKFVDYTFSDNINMNLTTTFFGPYCLTSELFPLGDINNKGTGTYALYHGFNKILQIIRTYIEDIIKNSPINEKFFYYPVKNYNNYNVGSNIVYKINENWNEYANDTVYADDMDNNVLYVHPYNFSKIMHNAIIESYSEISISAEGELTDYLDTETKTYYSGASVNKTNNGIEVSYDLNDDIKVNSGNLDGQTIDSITYDRITKTINSNSEYDNIDDNLIKDQIQTITKYRQKVNSNNTTDGMFEEDNVSGIVIKESDKVELFGKVYDDMHLNTLLNMTDEDFSCVTGFKEVDILGEDNETVIGTKFEQVIDKIGFGGKKNRFYEQHKRMFVDANTGYVKVKYEYIPIDFDKKYIIPDLGTDIKDIRTYSVRLNNVLSEIEKYENLEIPETLLNELEELNDILSQYYSIVSYMGLIIFDRNSGMFKRYKLTNKVKNSEDPIYYYKNKENEEYKDIIDKATLTSDFEFAEIVNGDYTYEYFNIVEKNTYIKINQSIKDYINIEDEHLYNDMYIYRPILDIEYDEKYSKFSKTEAILKNLLQIDSSIITDTSTMLYPCFNTIYKQDLKTTLLQLNLAVDNIRNVNLVVPKDLPNYTARSVEYFNSSYVTDTYYRYVLKDSALYIAVTKEKYEELKNKSVEYNYPAYDEDGNIIYKYLDGFEVSKDKEYYILYETDQDEYFFNYDIKAEYSENYKKYETGIISTGLKYYIKGEALYEQEKNIKHIPLYIQPVYRRRYIPSSIYFTSKNDNEIYKDNNINTFTDDNGVIYGYYLLNTVIDNSSNTLNIRAMFDTNTSINSYSDIDQISNINYVTLINDNDINTESGLKYYLSIFKQLCPFMYNNITNTMLSLNTIMNPYTFNVTNTYGTKQANTINNSLERDLVYVKQTILTAKKQVLQRYTNSIVPYIFECSNINNLYGLKLKECKATLLDTGNYLSIGDSVLESSVESIYNFKPYKIYGVSIDPNIKSYNNVVDSYTPIEYKYYDASKMINLETSIIVNSSKQYTYDSLLEAQSDKVTYNVFKTYIKRILSDINDDEILFLYNKYEKTYQTTVVGMSLDNTKKIYKLTYKFNLL